MAFVESPPWLRWHTLARFPCVFVNVCVAVFSLGLAPNYQKALDKLESMSTELNSMNPGFTVRRQLDEIRKESEQIEYLRNVGV